MYSRINVSLLFFLFLSVFKIDAQHNLFYVTAGMPALAINYERNIPTNNKIDFGLRAHMGIRQALSFVFDQDIPPSRNYYTVSGIVRLNKERIGFELNYGASYETSNGKGFEKEESRYRPHIGFRAMLYSSPLVFKFGFSNQEYLNFNIGYQF